MTDPDRFDPVAELARAEAEHERRMHATELELADAEAARRSFRAFIPLAWKYAEQDPKKSFKPNWHIDAVADHLEAVSRSEITKLVINIPPGTAKSLLVAVLFPAWQWTHNPAWRCISASYGSDLAIRDADRTRDVINSAWYQRHFARPGTPEGWGYHPSKNRRDDFSNTKSGRRIATSPDAKSTGERGDCVIGDDLLKVTDAYSEATRNSTNAWWAKAMSNRLDDMERGAHILMMQRIHEDDPAGYVLARNMGYEHLRLPSEYNPKKKCIVYITRPDGERVKFFEDPRTEPGELLFPALQSRKVIEQAKNDLGSDYSGQHDQDPTPSDGYFFKAAHWRFFRFEGEFPATEVRPDKCMPATTHPTRAIPRKFDQIVISLDAAFKGNADNDRVAMLAIGCLKADRFIIDAVAKRMDFGATIKEFAKFCAKHKAYRKLVEDKANGPAIISMLKSRVPGLIEILPEGGKEARAHACQPQIESGNVYLLEGASWLPDFVDECSKFPRGKNDDFVDALSQALNYLFLSADVANIIALGKK